MVMSVDGDQPDLLSVRETARRLGVHENTVRNWAKSSLLPTMRLPGSRFHRFDSRDVERLRRQRTAMDSSVEQERRSIGPELVSATQLHQWADTRDAQETFPELIRRLLTLTPGLTNISIRAGEGISAPGWDGRATCAGTSYLPDGALYFEFGVGGQPKQKADEDYEKRRDHPKGFVAADVKFIFVTPRRWSQASDWADSRRAEGVFADVQVLDADDVEGWLQATPTVHHWISEHLGRKPRDAQTLDQWWDRFQARTSPPLPPELFLTGREGERAELSEFLQGPAGVITVRAPWRDEAIAFVAATLGASQGDGGLAEAGLIVASAEVWDRVVAQPGFVTLLPVFADSNIALALEQEHHIILPIGQDQVASGTTIELPRPDRQGASEALERASVSADRAYRLAALARRSMPSLVRTLARDPRIARPPWTEPPSGAILAPLMLVGAWTAANADTEAAGRIVDKPWPEIERTLQAWAIRDDPPFVRTSAQWHLASPEEAFLVLRDSLSPADLARWKTIATEVLLERDPRLDLNPEDRFMAGLRGTERSYSRALRRGVAQGVALIGAMGEKQLGDGVTGVDHARGVVREILRQANEETSGRTWQSLEDVLPLLAEAAPEVFLDALHDDLDRGEPLLATMFQDADQGSILSSSSPHTGLLWALETLCWSPEFLPSATLALARLQAVDPGGRLSNRPLNSLATILVVWICNTSAPVPLRTRAVESICQQQPGVGWRLLLALWPSHNASSSSPAAPRFRDWKPEIRSISVSEYVDLVGSLVGLALDLAGSDAVLWSDLVGRLGALSVSERTRLLDALAVVVEDSNAMDAEPRFLLWEKLRKEVSHHRQFPSAAWSMDEQSLVRMQALADQLEPKTSVERFAHLFDWRPNLSGVDPLDHDTYDRELLKLRTQAVAETLRESSIDGVRVLNDRSPEAKQLGWIVGAVAGEDLTSDLLTWLDSDDPKQRELAYAWAQRKLRDGGVSWLRAALNHPNASQPKRRKGLVLNAPATSDVWDALFDIHPDLADVYWQGMNAWHVGEDDTRRAVRELLVHERPWIAMDLLTGVIQGKKEASASVTPDLVESVLDAALQADPTKSRSQSLGYEIGLLLDYLEAQRIDPGSIARYEFCFFRLLDHHRAPRALFTALAEDPDQFVALVRRVYRGKGEAKHQVSEQDEALAHHAWWVLAQWDSEFPGLIVGSTLSEDKLRTWVRQARDAFAESGHVDIGDEQIGQVLAGSPVGVDGVWPAEPVRALIEEIGSPGIETGIRIGVRNGRGVTSRGVFDGGQQERDLAAQYRGWERQTAARWRRTSRLLRDLADGFERDALWQDDDANLRADTE